MDDKTLHSFLDLILISRRNCERAGSSGEAVQELLKQTLRLVRDIMTEPVFQRAMRSGSSGEGVLLFANRLALVEPLLSDNWPADFSYAELVGEVIAIANGDRPKILKGKKISGKARNAHALLELKLVALGWYSLLRTLGLKANERQELILSSYNVTWSAVDKWKKEGREKLGAEYVDGFLFDFNRLNLQEAAMQADPVLWARGKVAVCGDTYRRKLLEQAD